MNSEIIISDVNKTKYRFQNCIITSNETHQLETNGPFFLLLLNPISKVSHYLTQRTNQPISDFILPLRKQLRQIGMDFINNLSDIETTTKKISKILNNLSCLCENENHFDDERIRTAIAYLETNYERVIPVEEIAEKCHLSASRFLHLFKEKTGITYRKIQQWNKIYKSFSVLFNQNITETAHEFGFTDSAHYTRTCIETFGFSPRSIKNIS